MYRTVEIIKPDVPTVSLSEESILCPTKVYSRPVSYHGAEVGHMRCSGNLIGKGVYLPTISGYVYEVVLDNTHTLVLILREDK